MFRVRDQQQLLFAAFLLAMGGLGLWLGWKLPMGTALRMGAGYLPKVLSCALLLFGAGLGLAALAVDGPKLEEWSWRGTAIVLASILVFGFAVERVGLLVTVFAMVLVTTAAAPDRRWREAALFGAVLAVFCTFLFRTLLGLPMPALPF
ncbi:MAG: tripartite tricarboxylate transporter TctB family protein [Alphaproteobacteria bacterium]